MSCSTMNPRTFRNFQKCFRLAIPPDRIAFERAALDAEPEYAALLRGLDGISPHQA